MRAIVAGLIAIAACGPPEGSRHGLKDDQPIDSGPVDTDDVDGDGFQDDDCDDNDATVFPGALEVLGDGIDHDCDSDPNATALAWATGLTGARGPTVGASTEHYVLTTAADTYFPDYTDVGISLIFDFRATGQQAPREDVIWTGASTEEPLGPQVDMVTFGENFFAVGNYYRPSNAAWYTTTVKTNYDWSVEAFKRTIASDYHGPGGPFSDTSARAAGTELQVASCAPDTVQVIGITANDVPFKSHTDVHADILGEGGEHCGLQMATPGRSVLHMGGANGIKSWDVDFGNETISLAPDQPFASLSANNIRISKQWIVIASTTGVTLSDESGGADYLVFGGQDIADADLSWFEGNAVLAAVIGETLHLAWGPDPASFTEATLSGVTGISGVSIYRDADRVFVAVLAGPDDIGWMFLAPPLLGSAPT